jgi:hypothetical protein
MPRSYGLAPAIVIAAATPVLWTCAAAAADPIRTGIAQGGVLGANSKSVLPATDR